MRRCISMQNILKLNYLLWLSILCLVTIIEAEPCTAQEVFCITIFFILKNLCFRTKNVALNSKSNIFICILRTWSTKVASWIWRKVTAEIKSDTSQRWRKECVLKMKTEDDEWEKLEKLPLTRQAVIYFAAFYHTIQTILLFYDRARIK